MRLIAILLASLTLLSITLGQAKLSGGAKLSGSTKASSAGGAGFSAFDAGFNFRSTSGYVTDGANQTYITATDTYPTTRSVGSTSVTFGWVVGNRSVVVADRNNAVDVRLAGVNTVDGFPSGCTTYFRVDLPAAGSYDTHLALGDVGYGQSGEYALVADTSTTVFTISEVATAAGHFLDATGADMLTGAWPTSEVSRTGSFATTQFRLTPCNPTDAETGAISHLRIVRIS